MKTVWRRRMKSTYKHLCNPNSLYAPLYGLALVLLILSVVMAMVFSLSFWNAKQQLRQVANRFVNGLNHETIRHIKELKDQGRHEVYLHDINGISVSPGKDIEIIQEGGARLNWTLDTLFNPFWVATQPWLDSADQLVFGTITIKAPIAGVASTIITAIVSLLFFFGFALYSLWRTLRSLRRLTLQVQALQYSGEAIMPVKHAPQEVYFLSRTLNKQYQEIQAYHHELKQRAQELQQQRVLERERYEWLHHELAKPVNIVMGNLELMTFSDSHLPAQTREELHVALSSASEVSFVLHALSAYLYRREEDGAGIRLETLELSQLCHDAIQLYPGVQLDVAFNIYVQGDFFYLKHILLNLLQNASRAVLASDDAMLEIRLAHEKITVSLHHDYIWSYLSVTDKGKGIPPEIRPHIFEPHFTMHRHEGGRGLGLPYARYLAELHGGTLILDSLPEEGTRFVIKLPLTHIENTLPIGDSEQHLQGAINTSSYH